MTNEQIESIKIALLNIAQDTAEIKHYLKGVEAKVSDILSVQSKEIERVDKVEDFFEGKFDDVEKNLDEIKDLIKSLES
ncbi:MAG: hypothetical protein JWM28_4501 [Chitinophagaceae bacterium]|nr:hypothetical protein [Chitinophagaceae bacterium]